MRISILRFKDVLVAQNRQIPEDQYGASKAPATYAVASAVQSHFPRVGDHVRGF